MEIILGLTLEIQGMSQFQPNLESLAIRNTMVA